jgi:fatty acid-binding protein DegV
MRAIRLNGTVSQDRELHLRLPSDAPPGPAEVIVLVQDADTEDKRSSWEALLKDAGEWAKTGKSKEEIDRYIEEERDSWERDNDGHLPG